MALGYGLPEAVRQWIQHAVVGVHRGQAVLVKLVSHDANKFLHPLIVICPVTYNLEERGKNRIFTFIAF